MSEPTPPWIEAALKAGELALYAVFGASGYEVVQKIRRRRRVGGVSDEAVAEAIRRHIEEDHQREREEHLRVDHAPGDLRLRDHLKESRPYMNAVIELQARVAALEEQRGRDHKELMARLDRMEARHDERHDSLTKRLDLITRRGDRSDG
jgi:hypothetical protein